VKSGRGDEEPENTQIEGQTSCGKKVCEKMLSLAHVTSN
jgi:hypothetical protein